MLSENEIINILKSTRLLYDVPADDLTIIAAKTKEINLPNKENVFLEGDKGDSIYFIARGQVSVHRSGIEIIRLGQNDFFGEMAILDDGVRSASVASVGDVTLLKINREDFYNALQENINILQNVLKVLIQRLREDLKREIEARKRLAILDKIKSDFLTLICHELRTPMTGIVAVSEMLFDTDVELDETGFDKFRAILQSSVSRLNTIIEHALLLVESQSSSEEITIYPISVNTVLRDSMESISDYVKQRAKNRRVSFDNIPECSSHVLGEAVFLKKALTAIIETAFKFSTEDSMVTLSCESVNGELWIRIRSVGRGIPEKNIDRFFEILSITDPITPGGDLGLGPPVSDRLIKLMGGSVSVENQDPPGVVFTVKLKLAENIF